MTKEQIELQQLRGQLIEIYDSIPKEFVVHVREGNGEESLDATIIVSLLKMATAIHNKENRSDCPCPHAASVSDKVKERARHGFNKYGKTCARTDLTELEWLVHAQEEAMDLAVYLQRLISDKLQLEPEKKGGVQ